MAVEAEGTGHKGWPPGTRGGWAKPAFSARQEAQLVSRTEGEARWGKCLQFQSNGNVYRSLCLEVKMLSALNNSLVVFGWYP